MGDTATNHELLIATKGTGHVAQTTGDTDVCFNPPKLVPSPHENYVSTSQLGAGQTTKTFIQEKPIVTMKGTIEPMSMPPHADTGGGVVSGTYRMEAKPTGGSPDVMAEGSPVCRTTDPTTQNHANTTGTFVEPSPEEKLRMEEEERVARCTLVKVIGECAGPGTPDLSQMDVSGPAIMSGSASAPGHNEPIPHGRKLYFPPGAKIGEEGYFLEVLSTDTVTLTATRENAVEKGGPVCVNNEHTKWVVKRSGGGEEPEEEEVIGQDVLILDPDWFGVPSIEEWGLKTSSRAKSDPSAAQKKAIDDKIASDMTPAQKKLADRLEAGDTRMNTRKLQRARSQRNGREAARELANKDQKAKNKAAQDTLKLALNVAQNAAKVYYYWNYLNDPVTLQITALGCSGSKNVTLRCYPVGKFEFDLFSAKVAENVAKIKALADLFQKIAAIFRKRGRFEFLKGPQLLLTTEYKELKEDKNGLLKSQVNRYWEISIGFEKFVDFSIEFTLPLLNFFGPMGAAANLFLNAFGIEGDAYLSLALAVNPKVAAKWTEYNEASIGEFKVTIKVEVQIGARARWRDIAEIYAAGYVEVSVEFTEPKIAKEYLFQCKAKGSLQIGVKAGGYASWWGFSKSFEINYKPPDWKYSLGEGPLHFVKLS